MGIHSLATAAAAALAITAAAASGASAAQLITNGSFEAGTFVDGTGQDTDNVALGDSTTMSGWTVIGGHYVSWIGPSNPFGLTASAGSYFLDLTGYAYGAPFAGVQQTIATVPGASYSLGFDLGSSAGYGLPAGITASAGATSQTFTSTLTGSDNHEHETLAFVAAGASTVISLVGEQGQNFIGLDDVSVTGAAPIPEPLTAALVLTAAGMLAGPVRRRGIRRPAA